MTESYCIQHGLVFDGEGEGIEADVLIRDGRVVDVRPGGFDPPSDCTRIDAKGMWITPGFIDVHTHYDAEIEAMPELSESLRHGVTTVFLGSCGLSMVMGEPDDLCDMFTRVEGLPRAHALSVIRSAKTWDGPNEYADHLRALPLGPHVAAMLGHSTVRAAVMGLERSVKAGVRPTADEMSRMEHTVEEALDAGFVGLSVNTLGFDKMDGDRFRSSPTPSVFASFGEMQALMGVVRRRRRVTQAVPGLTSIWTNMRLLSESATWGRRDPMKLSMLAMIDARSARGAHRVIGAIMRAGRKLLGADVRVQGLPHRFDFWVDGIDTPIFEEFEPGAAMIHVRDVAAKRALLASEKYKRWFRRAWRQRLQPRMFHRKLADTEIVECADSSLVGRSFADVARARSISPVDAFLDAVLQHHGNVRWRTCLGNDRDDELAWMLANPDFQLGFSDAGAHVRNQAHYDSTLRMLRLVRDRTACGLPSISVGAAVRRATSELADWFGIDAGRVAIGRRADVVVIDPTQLDDGLHHYAEVPMRAFGGVQRLVRRNDEAVPYVFVSGRLAWQKGRFADDLGSSKGYGTLHEAR